MNDKDLFPAAGEALQVVSAMRRAVALLDDSAEMLDRLARLGSDDVTADFRRHADVVRAIRRQVAGPPPGDRRREGCVEAEALGCAAN